jgi:hypothetical protein
MQRQVRSGTGGAGHRRRGDEELVQRLDGCVEPVHSGVPVPC